MSDSSELVGGDVDDGYGPVADAFRRNMLYNNELGAACAVYHEGRKVVDLWGGHADRRAQRPWRADTEVVMFSTTKGMASLTLALAHSRGLLDHDQRVAFYWPEFGWRGKEQVTVRQLLSHEAGVPVVDIPLTVSDLADPDLVAAAIALQKPQWAPGTRHGYHAISLGWYESELLRRVDPDNRSLGTYFAEEIAGPHGIDFHIGVPADYDLSRRAELVGRGPWEALRHAGDMPRKLFVALINPRSLTRRAFANPKEMLVDVNLNRPDVLAVEIPAANGIGTPRAVAAAYSTALDGRLGLESETLDALSQPPAAPSGGLEDVILKGEALFSLGYLKPSPSAPFGGSANLAFGTPGNGGSFGLADPETKIGYCYAPSRLGTALLDQRDIALRNALFRDVLRDRAQDLRR